MYSTLMAMVAAERQDTAMRQACSRRLAARALRRTNPAVTARPAC